MARTRKGADTTKATAPPLVTAAAPKNDSPSKSKANTKKAAKKTSKHKKKAPTSVSPEKPHKTNPYAVKIPVAKISNGNSTVPSTVSSSSGSSGPSLLETLGIEVIKKKNNKWSPIQPGKEYNAKMKFAYSKSPDGVILFIFSVPVNKSNARDYWPEKLMIDAFFVKRNNKLQNQLEMKYNQEICWHINDEPVCNITSKDPNGNHWPLRLLYLPMVKMIPKEKLVELGNEICDEINAMEKNFDDKKNQKSNIICDPSDLFVLEPKKMNRICYYDIIGNAGSLFWLQNEYGTPMNPSYFEKIRGMLSFYFPSRLHPGIAATIYAPITYCDPSDHNKYKEYVAQRDGTPLEPEFDLDPALHDIPHGVKLSAYGNVAPKKPAADPADMTLEPSDNEDDDDADTSGSDNEESEADVDDTNQEQEEEELEEDDGKEE